MKRVTLSQLQDKAKKGAKLATEEPKVDMEKREDNLIAMENKALDIAARTNDAISESLSTSENNMAALLDILKSGGIGSVVSAQTPAPAPAAPAVPFPEVEKDDDDYSEEKEPQVVQQIVQQEPVSYDLLISRDRQGLIQSVRLEPVT